MGDNYASLEGWVREFAADVWERLEEEEDENGRMATQLVVHVSVEGDKAGHSKRCKLRPGVDAMVGDAMSMLRNLTSERPPQRLGITGVGLSGDSFVSSVKAERGALQRMFQSNRQSVLKKADIVEPMILAAPTESGNNTSVPLSDEQAQPI